MKRYKVLLFLIGALVLGHSSAFAQTATATATSTATATATATAQVTPVPSFEGEHRAVLSGVSNAVVSNSAANVFAVMGSSLAVATTSEGDVLSTLATGGVIHNLWCYTATAAGVPTVAGGTSYVVALRQAKAGAGLAPATTALSCTISALLYECSDMTDNVYVNPGDSVDFIDTPSGTPTALGIHCFAELDM